MTIYAVEIDQDMTTRSNPYIYGYYTSEARALQTLRGLNLEDWMWQRIIPIEVEE